MATFAAKTADGGVSNLSVGDFTADGTVTDVVLGFYPRHVTVFNMTDATSWEWVLGMPATNSVKTVTAGTTTTDTTSAIVPKGLAATDTYKGFQLTAAAAASGKKLVFYAEG